MSGETSRTGELSKGLTYGGLLVLSAAIFLVLPFVTTFNEFLTKIVENIGLYMSIQSMVVPVEARMVGAVLRFVFGIETSVSSSSLYLQEGGRIMQIYISWNCIGWQSLILYIFTVITGLQGPYTKRSKLLSLLLGLEGTFLVNLARIVLVVVVVFLWGYLPAIIIHDYGGTIIILAWLVLFWHYSYRYILQPIPGAGD